MTTKETIIEVIKNKDSFSVLVNKKILCSMSGGCHRFRTFTEAEYAAKQYVRGYIGGSYLSADVENFITT